MMRRQAHITDDPERSEGSSKTTQARIQRVASPLSERRRKATLRRSREASHGPLVKRSRHRPLTPVTRVRFPHGSPFTHRLVYITLRSHLFPSRTQKLSSAVPKILGGRLPGKIGLCQLLPKPPVHLVPGVLVLYAIKRRQFLLPAPDICRRAFLATQGCLIPSGLIHNPDTTRPPCQGSAHGQCRSGPSCRFPAAGGTARPPYKNV